MALETKRALRPPPRVPVRMLKTGDENTDRAVRALVSATEKSRQDQHAKGKDVTLTIAGAPANKTFSHGLGYAPKNFRPNSYTNRHVTFTVVSADSRSATLAFSSGTGTINLRVY